MKPQTFLPILLFLALILSACSPAQAQSGDPANRPIQVVATTGMIAYTVEQVGGDQVEVTGLMGPGVDPHLYRVSEGDLRALERAEIVFYNGLHLEAGMTGVLERMAEQGKAKAVTDPIDRSLLKAPPEFQGAYDPHVWFDVQLWMQTVEAVQETLAELDPSSATQFAANADAYLAELEELDAYVRAQAERVPADQRVLITAHDAFHYFGDAYGFEVRGLQGISTETEASTADVRNLADLILERQVPAVFIESSVPQRNIEAVQAAVEARGFNVQIGGELYSDAMGDPSTPEGTFPGMVRYNIDTIVSALLDD